LEKNKEKMPENVKKELEDKIQSF